MPPNITNKGIDTIHGAVLESCRKNRLKPALVSAADQNRELSYKDLETLINLTAENLLKLGSKQNDRIGLLGENSPEWGILYLSIMSIGGVVVPIDSFLKYQELVRIFKLSGIRHVFCSDLKLKSIGEQTEISDLPVKVHKIENLVDSGGNLPDNYSKLDFTDVKPENLAVLIYTSGTTGDPKGVMLTHRNIVSNIRGFAPALHLDSTNIFLSILPMHHTFEATTGFLYPLFTGMTIVYARSLKSRDILTDIKNHQITCLVAVPLFYEKLFNTVNKRISDLPPIRRLMFTCLYKTGIFCSCLKLKAGKLLFRNFRKKAGFTTIRFLISGGAALMPQVAEWFNTIGITLVQGYGMTECSPVVSVNRYDNIRFDSVGPPLDNVEIKIDQPMPDGIGEILVKSPANTSGYLNNKKATDELLHDGWLYTGDLGRLHDGHLYITGRKKNLIISAAGKNIYPEEIEAELNSAPWILESLVTGRPRENRAGEDVIAIIVPDIDYFELNGDTSSEFINNTIANEVKAVNDRLAVFKRITAYEMQMEPLQKTSTRKIKRNIYRKSYGQNR